MEFIKNLESQAQKQPKTSRSGIGEVRLPCAPHCSTSPIFAWPPTLTVTFCSLTPTISKRCAKLGNLNYYRQKYDQAIAAYEHYLKHKPDDLDVQTDLGTMYLYTGNADQAIKRYQKALSIRPNAFEPYYNLGVAYAALNNNAQARASLQQAIKYAPDQHSENAGQRFAREDGRCRRREAGCVIGPVRWRRRPCRGSGGAGRFLRRADRGDGTGLAVCGTEGGGVKWTSKNKATVLMNNFPMEAMPPFARQKFLGDLADGIQGSQEDLSRRRTV